MRRYIVAWLASLAPFSMPGLAQAGPINSLTVEVPEVYTANPSASQTSPDSIAWTSYDNFSGSSVDTTLWHSFSTAGSSSSAGPGGLTLAPAQLSGPGYSDASVEANLPVYPGTPFAFMVPFSISDASANLPGLADLNIDICGADEHTQCDSVAWGLANHYSVPGNGNVSGTMFAAGASLPNPPVIQSTGVSTGKLADIYNGTSITNFINDGTGWQQLGSAYSPPSSWDYNPGSYSWGAPSKPFLLFQIDAEVQATSASTVSEPPSAALLGLGLGLLGWAFGRRKKASVM